MCIRDRLNITYQVRAKYHLPCVKKSLSCESKILSCESKANNISLAKIIFWNEINPHQNHIPSMSESKVSFKIVTQIKAHHIARECKLRAKSVIAKSVRAKAVRAKSKCHVRGDCKISCHHVCIVSVKWVPDHITLKILSQWESNFIPNESDCVPKEGNCIPNEKVPGDGKIESPVIVKSYPEYAQNLIQGESKIISLVRAKS